MLEKILKRLMPPKAVKKAVMFFAAFVLTITVICAGFTEVRGDTVTADTADSNANVEITGTHGTVGAKTVEQTAVTASQTVRATALHVPAKQTAEAGYIKDEPVIPVPADAQAESVQIKLQTAEHKSPIVKNQGSEEFVYSDKIPLSYELQEYIFHKSAEQGLEYELVLAVIWRESRFNTGAVNLNSNGTTDSGLMQINDVNRAWLYEKHGIDNLMDPYQNIDAGTALLGDLYKKYGEHGAMMAYQYGESGMIKKMSQGVTTNRSIEAAYRQREYYRQLV